MKQQCLLGGIRNQLRAPSPSLGFMFEKGHSLAELCKTFSEIKLLLIFKVYPNCCPPCVLNCKFHHPQFHTSCHVEWG